MIRRPVEVHHVRTVRWRRTGVPGSRRAYRGINVAGFVVRPIRQLSPVSRTGALRAPVHFVAIIVVRHILGVVEIAVLGKS